MVYEVRMYKLSCKSSSWNANVCHSVIKSFSNAYIFVQFTTGCTRITDTIYLLISTFCVDLGLNWPYKVKTYYGTFDNSYETTSESLSYGCDSLVKSQAMFLRSHIQEILIFGNTVFYGLQLLYFQFNSLLEGLIWKVLMCKDNN